MSISPFIAVYMYKLYGLTCGGRTRYVNYPRDAILARVLAVVACPSVRHTPVLYRNGCTDPADFLHAGFPRPMPYHIFGEIKVSPKIRVLPFGTFANCEVLKFSHGAPTVGECDKNSDSGRSVADSTWRGGSRRGRCGLQSTTIADC